jgi:hypothetical protein
VLAASIIRVMMMEAERTSETSINFYQAKRCNNREDSLLIITISRTTYNATKRGHLLRITKINIKDKVYSCHEI